MILYDETIRQKADDGTSFPKLLEDKGVLPGIKVDTGSKPLALFSGEQVTEGLDGLRERIAEYVSLGAKFAKWRAVIMIDTVRHPQRRRHRRQRRRPRPLRRPVPGGWAGADHRARGADGRRATTSTRATR